jgi:hypothetical protein
MIVQQSLIKSKLEFVVAERQYVSKGNKYQYRLKTSKSEKLCYDCGKWFDEKDLEEP